MRSTSTIDLEYIEKRIREIEEVANPSDIQKSEISSLEERKRIFDQHRERVSRLLSENESAMTVLDKTAAAFAETETGKGGASMDISEAMRELEMLAKRAHRYKR